MFTINELEQQLQGLGIESTDLITVHTSLKAIGEVEDRAEGVIAALKQSVRDGLLLIPTHTWLNIFKLKLYDVKASVPCIGTLPKIAVEMANSAYESGDLTCRRSLHPTHSVVAFGKKALEYIKDDEIIDTPIPEKSSYGKLKHFKGKILLLGVDLTKNTFIHYMDELKASDRLPKYDITVIDYEGNKTKRTMCATYGDSLLFEELYREYLENAGALRFGKFGNAEAIVCDAEKCFNAIMAYDQAL